MFANRVVTLLERELAHERESRSKERMELLARVQEAEARAAAAEDYSRKLAELMLERKAGVRTLTAPARPEKAAATKPEEAYEPLSDAEARLQAMAIQDKIDFSSGRAEYLISAAERAMGAR